MQICIINSKPLFYYFAATLFTQMKKQQQTVSLTRCVPSNGPSDFPEKCPVPRNMHFQRQVVTLASRINLLEKQTTDKN